MHRRRRTVATNRDLSPRPITIAGMPRYRIELHGHLIEARHNSLSMGEVLLNGRPLPRSMWSAVLERPVHFDITDEHGKSRAVEIRWVQTARSLGLRHRVAVSVDGVERALLDPEPEAASGPGRCLHCGYALKGLTPTNGEVQCPECGRHTSAKIAGIEP